jgi:AAA domain
MLARDRTIMEAFERLDVREVRQPAAVGVPPDDDYYEPPSDIPESVTEEPEVAIPAAAPKPIKATPFAVRDPSTLPVRDVLYGRHLIRGFVAGLVGIGGGGKSTLTMAENFARVSGKPLLGVEVRAPLRCWSINLEDPRDEIDRRAQATCLYYGLTEQDIGDRLFLDSGRDQPVVIARTLAGGTRIMEPVVDNIIAEVIARKIDVLTIDPFVSSHEVPENDNGAIDLVIKKAWGAVAERGGCAVELVHHLRKIGDDEPTVDAARGAGALVAGLRALRVLAGMTKAEAERASVENPYRYFRVFSGKLNMAPREDKSDWHYLESVDLGNRTVDRPSDHVQVAVPWQWPNALDGLATRDLFAVQKHVSEGQWRESSASPDWVGKAVAGVLELDPESAPDQTRIKSLLKTWIKTGALKVVEKPDATRRNRKFVEVGQWATD